MTNPQDRNRTANHMLLLSGLTGEMIGRGVYVMPDGRESYSLPVMYTWADGSQYVVFGTGGETVSGESLSCLLPCWAGFSGYDYVHVMLCYVNVESIVERSNMSITNCF